MPGDYVSLKDTILLAIVWFIPSDTRFHLSELGYTWSELGYRPVHTGVWEMKSNQMVYNKDIVYDL